jgi:hypothetical protein
MSNVLIVSGGRDVAGCGIALKKAFDHYGGEWKARAVRRAAGPYSYDSDITWTASSTTEEVQALWEEADVIHVMDHISGSQWFPTDRQKVVVHHLGSRFRSNHIALDAYCRERGYTQVTDSFDLMYWPHIGWLPVAADTDRLRARTIGRPQNPIPLVAHAPTNRAFYSTNTIIQAFETVAGLVPADLDLIEGVSNEECLQRKALADVYIDGLTLGYGMNAIECWSMGIPVVSGLKDPKGRAFMRERFGGFPFDDATEQSLFQVLLRILEDKRHRLEMTQLGLDHVRKWHSEPAVVRQTLEVYSR